MDERFAGRAGQTDVARLDRGIGVDGDIDQPPLLVRKSIQALVQILRVAIERSLAGVPKGRDGVGNSVVEATVERTKLVRGNGRVLFDGQSGNGLAHISITVDNLVDTESEAKQFSAVQGRGATDFG